MKIIYKAKALGATNHKGFRIKVTNMMTQESKILDKDYSINFSSQVIKYVTEMRHYAKFEHDFVDGDNFYFIFEGE